MADEKQKGMGDDFHLELDDELDLNLDEFEDFSSIEDEFWAPYNQSLKTGRSAADAGDVDEQTTSFDPVGDLVASTGIHYAPAAPAFAQEEPTQRTFASGGQEPAGGRGEKTSGTPSKPKKKQQSMKAAPAAAYVKKKRIPGGVLALLYVVLVIGGSILLATLGWMWANDMLGLNKSYRSTVVEISSETTAQDVAETLKDEGIIQYPGLFRLYCNLSHANNKLAFGSYEVNTDMDYHALIAALSSSSSTMLTTQLLIPEGYTIDQIFNLLVENGVCETVEELQDMAATHDYRFSFLSDIPLGDYHRLEGFLFPDTYEFYLGQDPLYVLNKMLVNFDLQVTDEMRQQAADMGYSIQDILKMASMIEKETSGSDQRDIASVIYNRLNSDVTFGLLQFDSTVQYVLEYIGQSRKEDLTLDDLAIDNPYNTYVYAGLPAGPICNPGLASIQAVLNPNDTDYIYFLQDAYGNSYFYQDYDEFIAAQATYLADDYVAPQEDNSVNYEEFEDNG